MQIRKWAGAGVGATLLALAWTGLAAAASPVGLWQTIDDETGKPKALVEIKNNDGVLSGRIVRLLNPSKPNPTCDKCSGDKKGQPITGMEILWGLKKDGADWSGGQILDPQKGKVYGAKLKPSEDGKSLSVRGFMGVSLLGRTQTWHRAPDGVTAVAPEAP